MSISAISGKSTTDVRQYREKRLDLLEVGRGDSAWRLEHGAEDARLLHHAARQHLIQRRQSHGEVGKPLGDHAPRAEDDHRAELPVLLHAEDEFVVDLADHGLDGNALDDGLGRALLHAGEHALVRRLEVRRRADVQLHAADGVLVRDTVRDDLEHDRIAELLGGCLRLGEIVSRLLPDDGESVRRDEPLRLLLGQHLSSRMRDRPQHCLKVVLGRRHVDGQLRRRLVEQFEVPAYRYVPR